MTTPKCKRDAYVCRISLFRILMRLGVMTKQDLIQIAPRPPL